MSRGSANGSFASAIGDGVSGTLSPIVRAGLTRINPLRVLISHAPRARVRFKPRS